MSNFYTGGKSLKSDQFKDDYHIMEMENEIKILEPIVNSMMTEFAESPTFSKYVTEVERLWEALKKSQTNSKAISEIVKENMATISAFNLKIANAGEANQNDQKIISKLQQEVQRALRMVDTAHTREQVAQETVENLRQQITWLHQELEQKSKSLDQDGEYSSIAKNKEAMIKERERMVYEIQVLKEKLQATISYQEELEKKNSFADLRVAELTQELENQSNEMSKESRFKERFEDDLQQVKKELVMKEADISQLNSQLLEFQRSTLQLKNTLKEQKIMADRLNQTIEQQQQRILKLIDDLQRETGNVEECHQKITVINKQMKLKEDRINKMILEQQKTTKVHDSYIKKLNKMEADKNDVVDQKKKLHLEIETLTRTIDDNKHVVDVEKKKVENLIREKEIINKNAVKTAELLSEQIRAVRIQEQARLHLEQEIDNNRYDLAKQSQELIAMEKEKDRYVSECVVLTKRVEAALEDVKLKQSAVYDYKKKLAKVEAQLSNKNHQYESVRYELNICSKNLIEAQDDISDLKQKSKVMTLQIEQLKDDIAGKEMQLIRVELALRKAHGEKEAMRVEIQNYKDELEQARATIGVHIAELDNLQNLVRKADAEKSKDMKEKDKIMNEKDILSTQLVRRNDEVTLLREKIKVLQSTMDKEELHYAQRIEDIRLLKLEVKKLSSEKQVLTNSLENMVDLRSEVHHLEKSLAKERLKARALQDEQQNPMNVHRWRKLEGSDPTSLELVQKVRIKQRRILELNKSMLQLQNKYEVLEKQNKLLSGRQPLSENIIEMQRDLKLRENKIKGLTAELNMRVDQVADYKNELDKLNQELAEIRKKFFDQKQKAEKLYQQLEATKVHKPEITVSDNKLGNGADVVTNNKCKLPMLPQKPRFTGGGFNMEVWLPLS